MNIQPISLNYQTKNPSFGSVYPIYHWNYKDGKVVPVFDVKTAKTYQRKILSILNGTIKNYEKLPKQFLKSILEYFSKHDSDYKKESCALSFYNNQGGVKTSWNGYVYGIAPCTYLITGEDALFFEKYYRRPIGYTKYDAKIYNIDKNPEIKDSMVSYAIRGAEFVQKKEEDFSKKYNLEMHAIFKDNELIKIGFYPKSGNGNPFVKMGYYEAT